MKDKEDLIERKRACIWMINHYMDLANQARNLYPDIVDFYLVYDHCMMAVEVLENKMEGLCNG